MSWSEGSSLFFLVGEGGEGELFSSCVLVWRVDGPLFTFHLDSGKLTFHECVFLG